MALFFFWSSLAVQSICLIICLFFFPLRALISSSQRFGCSHLSFKGKSIRNTVALSCEENGRRKEDQLIYLFFFCFFFLVCFCTCKSKFEKQIFITERCETWFKIGCFFFFWEKCNSIFSYIARWTWDNRKIKERQNRSQCGNSKRRQREIEV